MDKAIILQPLTPEQIDTYLAALPESQRTALTHLRRIIRAAAPDAEEIITSRLAGMVEAKESTR